MSWSGGIDAANEASIALHRKLGFIHAGLFQVSGSCFGAGAHMQFLVDAPEMGANRGHADPKLVRDFLVGIAFREKFEDACFALGQFCLGSRLRE